MFFIFSEDKKISSTDKITTQLTFYHKTKERICQLRLMKKKKNEKRRYYLLDFSVFSKTGDYQGETTSYAAAPV